MIKELIPDFRVIEDAIKKLIKERQDEKGYVAVSKTLRNIFTLSLDNDGEYACEMALVAFRVKNDNLEFYPVRSCMDISQYDDEDFSQDEPWESIASPAYPYAHTIIAIACGIEDAMQQSTTCRRQGA